jgi:hypothetical protein
MDSVKEWHLKKRVETTLKGLEASGFDCAFFPHRNELVAKVLEFVRPGMKVGFGGSVTLRQLGLPDAIAGKKAIALDHWREGLTADEIRDVRLQQLTCGLFLSGVNAITEKGEIVNIDGIGNRVNSMTFGPKKVILIGGYNKLVPSLDAALERIRMIAAPMNAKRLGLALPCVESGRCHDCKSDARICRVISIMQRRPSMTDASVYLLNEELGF